MPSLGGDDDLRIGPLDEWRRLQVVDVDEGVDGALEIDERMEHAVLVSPARQLGEKSLDGI